MKLIYLFALIFIQIKNLFGYEELIRSIVDTNIKCNVPDISNQVGVVYLFLPNRFFSTNEKSNQKNGTVFQLHHFYSLLLLAKLFKSNPNNRLLFYYIKDSSKPISNHYNRWLEDKDWLNKIGHNSIKFVPIDYSYSDGINMYDLIAKIKYDSLNHFDNLSLKSHIIMSTSDVLVGPKLLSCFTKDLFVNNLDSSVINTHTVRAKMTSECYESIHKGDYFSFLYKIESIHKQNDFSGLFIWKLNDFIKTESQFKQELHDKYVNSFNNYKCHYKRDVINAQLNSLNSFENSYCVFGFEINAYDIPKLEDVFFKQNYMNQLVRKYIFNSSELITYKKKNETKIPNVVHLIWFSDGSRPLKFIEYLCLKSILLVVKPDKIRIHGDVKPIGEYWNELIQYSNKIEWVQRERNLLKYGQNFEQAPIQHIADFTRLEVLHEEGGIYSDFDILWVKPLDELRKINAEIIASNDITSYCDDFPNSIQIGAFLSIPKSEFVSKWLNGYKNYHLYPGDYAAVSMCEPYKIYEKEPEKVFIENRLQLIYFNGWSAFIPRYMEYSHEKLADFNSNLDWLNDGAYAYHLPRHSDLFSIEEFKKANKSSLPIRIASYIYNLELI